MFCIKRERVLQRSQRSGVLGASEAAGPSRGIPRPAAGESTMSSRHSVRETERVPAFRSAAVLVRKY